mgnify:FL=1
MSATQNGGGSRKCDSASANGADHASSEEDLITRNLRLLFQQYESEPLSPRLRAMLCRFASDKRVDEDPTDEEDNGA